MGEMLLAGQHKSGQALHKNLKSKLIREKFDDITCYQWL